MKKYIAILVSLLIAVVGIYFMWSVLDRTVAAAEPTLYLDDISSYGEDRGSGNLVAMQTYMQTTDYATAEAYRAKLDAYMAEADAQGWLKNDTVVVFGEEVGAWLVVVNEKQAVYDAQTVEEGVQALVLSNLPAFLDAYDDAVGDDKIRDSLFRMKAETMARIHQETFSELAQKYGVTIVAGSLFLPEPAVVDGLLVPGDGPLYNVSPVFHPNGRLDQTLIKKAFITTDEAAFIAPASADQNYTFETPAGNVAVLICADSWYLEPYEILKSQEPEAIVVPNAFLSDIGWDAIWQGTDNWPLPEDVDPADIGTITEGEARLKYTLDGRMQATGATTGMHAFLRGELWDLLFHGHTIIFTEDGVIEADDAARGAIVNYWLPQ